MKTQHSFFTILMICLCSTSFFAQSGLQKTLISIVAPGESNLVFFDLPGEVNVHTWDRNYIKVEMDILTNLENEKVFDYLKESGRYCIKKDYNSYYFMVLNLSNLREEITVNKVALEESFKFRVMVPWDLDTDVVSAKGITIEQSFEEEEGNDFLSYQIKE